MTYRKIGGMHWLALGRVRVSWCVTKPKACPWPKVAPKARSGLTLAKLYRGLDWAYAPKLLAIKAMQAIAQMRS